MTNTLTYWPEHEIMYIASMSPKTLIRMHGETVDENNELRGHRERELRRKIARARAEVRESDKLRIKKKQQGLKGSNMHIGNTPNANLCSESGRTY